MAIDGGGARVPGGGPAAARGTLGHCSTRWWRWWWGGGRVLSLKVSLEKGFGERSLFSALLLLSFILLALTLVLVFTLALIFIL